MNTINRFRINAVTEGHPYTVQFDHYTEDQAVAEFKRLAIFPHTINTVDDLGPVDDLN